MTMLDRLARALAAEDGRLRGNTYAINAINAGVGMTIDYWNGLAAAVLRELLTPTDGMVAAGTDLWLGAGNTSADWAAKLTDTHRAMIQAAIEGG